MQVTTIVITLGMIWKWSLNTGGLLIEVVIRSGLTVYEDMVEILMMMQVFIAEDPEIK